MYYKYHCADKIINVFRYGDISHNVVLVRVDQNEIVKAYISEIKKDEKGEFFIWQQNKIYLNDWIKSSMKDFKRMMENKENVTTSDLCQAILSDGVENVRFEVPMNPSSDEGYICKIEEKLDRKVEQNYKIVLVPVHKDENIVSSIEYYINDLLGLIEEDLIKIIV